MARRPTDEELLDPQAEPEDLDLDALIAMADTEEPPPERALPPSPTDADRVKELDALLAARAPRSGPGAAEMELMANYKPRPGWQNVLANVGAAMAESTGSPGAIARVHGAQAEERNRHLMELAAAREKDRAAAPLDRGSAELMMMAGLTPKAASELTWGSPAVKLAQSGMGQLGARYRQMDLTDAQKQAALESRTKDLETRLDAQSQRQQFGEGKKDERLDKTLSSREKIAAEKHKGGGGGPGLSPEQKQGAIASVFATQANVPRDKALAFLAGNKEGLAPEELERLENFSGQWSLLNNKSKQDALKANMAREASNPDVVTRGVDAKKADPGTLFKLKQEIDEKGTDIAAARRAWKSMSDGAKKALAKYGGGGGALGKILQQINMSEADRAYASEVQNMANMLIKAQSGAAVSEGEWGRLAKRMGFAEGDVDIMNSPATIQGWLDRMGSAWVQLKNNAVGVYGDDLKKLWGAPNGRP